MRICHLCLSGTYNEGWNYQENILPKYHVKMGLEVYHIVLPYEFDDKGAIVKVSESRYINDYGVHVIRLACKRDNILRGYFKYYPALYSELQKINPDILFIHDCQYVDAKTLAEFLKNNSSVKCFIDSHADFSNSATNWLSKNILHKIIWRHYEKMLVPYATKIYGVLPARIDFLVKMYGIPREKISLLVMGADDELVNKNDALSSRKEINEKYSIAEDDFLIVTGGKIDLAKTQTINLMEAVKRINNERVKLIIFGSVVEELREKVDSLADNKNIIYAGWIKANESFKYFAAADLVIFPGRHSVFWEQVVAQGKPLIVKDWPGTHHIDIGGNVEYLTQDSTDEIVNIIMNLLDFDNGIFYEMKRNALSDRKNKFLYSTIARESITPDQ